MDYRLILFGILINTYVSARGDNDQYRGHWKQTPTKSTKKKCLTLFQDFKTDDKMRENEVKKRGSVSPSELGDAARMPRGMPFSIFDSDHMDAAVDLIKFFKDVKTSEEFCDKADRIKHMVNQLLYTFVLYHVIEVKGFDIDVPSYAEVYPEFFITTPNIKAFLDRKEIIANKKGMSKSESRDLPPGEYRITVQSDLRGDDREIEKRVAYFRQDYGINEHYTNWHIAHLFFPRDNITDWPEVSRKGEYFVYSHQQAIARYNLERLSANIPLVKPYDDPLYSPIKEGYFPNIGMEHQSKSRRAPDMKLRIIEGNPHQKKVISKINKLKKRIDSMIDEERIDDAQFLIALENYHNMGQLIISNINIKVDARKPGVMSEPATAMRDPVFFRWHQHIDNLSDKYLDVKRRAHNERLSYDFLSEGDFEVKDLEVSSQRDGEQRNQLVTGCNFHTIEATNGLDMKGKDTTFIDTTHLDHIPFEYKIRVDNRNSERMDKRGLVRIFLGPKYDEKGREFDYESQRRLWSEMDKFFYDFKPGMNTIKRRSLESTVTVNCRNSFRDIIERINANDSPIGFCGCGWPQHMLLPKGNVTGMAFLMFVMVTAEPDNPDFKLGRSTYCGDPNESYDNDPDPRPMGYPFHEVAPVDTKTIQEFDRKLNNALVRDITIRFSGEQVDPKQRNIDGCRNPKEFHNIIQSSEEF